MADQKITALVAGIAVLTTDILPYVEDPGGTPVTKKITVADFKASIFASPTIVTPTIASFTNAQHDHSNAAGGANIGTGAVTGLAEFIRDTMATAIVQGSNMTITVNDGADTITFAAASGGSPAGSDGDYQINSSSSFAAGVIAQGSNGRIVITPTAASSGVAPYLRVIAPADTGQTADAEAPGIVLGGNSSSATVTRTLADGTTIALQREAIVVHPTYAAAGATTLTIAATLAITGAPVAGASITITNAYAFYIAAGRARFDGGVTSPGGAQSEKFGNLATATGSFAVTVGNTGANGSDNGVLVGALSTINAACDGAIVIGSQSGVTGSTGGAIVIGKVAGTGTGGTVGANSISIGIGSIAKTANTIVFGGSSQPINVLYGGKGEDHATPVVFTLSGSHGLGTNIAGADIAIQAGAGSGTGISGAIIFKTSPVGSSGTTRSAPAECARFNTNGVLAFPTTITTPGTTGNQTINKQSGTVNIAAAGTSVTVTNSLVTANSYVFAEIRTADATARIASVVPSAGSFVINIVACTLEVAIQWFVLNQ